MSEKHFGLADGRVARTPLVPGADPVSVEKRWPAYNRLSLRISHMVKLLLPNRLWPSKRRTQRNWQHRECSRVRAMTPAEGVIVRVQMLDKAMG
jgi:hypothetical protein